ncbi:MAG: hypothetical protein ABW049_04495 [Spongiibacteraceae bacterium]
MYPLSLCHYTISEVPPPELVEIAAATGFESISLMLQFPRGDERGYSMLGATAMRRETKLRLADSGVALFDVSICRLSADIELDSYRART